MSIFLRSGSVLAVHPTSSGFGWALFDEAGVLMEWGIASAKEGRKLRLLSRFKHLLARHEPASLVFEAHEGTHHRADRIRKLYRAFLRVASNAGMTTRGYDREGVAVALNIPLHASRYEVARRIAERLAELSHRMPRKQAFGASEDPRQSLFTAAALGLAHLTERGVPLPPVHPGAPE
jgi:hypothetical protein